MVSFLLPFGIENVLFPFWYQFDRSDIDMTVRKILPGYIQAKVTLAETTKIPRMKETTTFMWRQIIASK